MTTASDVLPAGLFQLPLRSVVPSNAPIGTPILTLTLSVDSPNNTVAGHATVTFKEVAPGADSVVSQYYVTGTLTYGGPRVMGATTEALIDLTGYSSVIHIPPGGGPGPVLPPRFKSNIVINKALTEGSVTYEFLRGDKWQRVEQQIARID